jgi:hypothetical protein
MEDDSCDPNSTNYSLRKDRPSFSTPVGPPRGTHGGRRRKASIEGDDLWKQGDDMHSVLPMNAPGSIERRAASNSTNAAARAADEQARSYKHDHQIGDRSQVKIVEKIVYQYPPRRKVIRETDPGCEDVRHLISEEQEAWLRQYVRTKCNSREGSKFSGEIRLDLKANLNLDVSEKQLALIFRSMGIEWQKLKSTKYLHAGFDHYNIQRRNLVAPILHWFLNDPRVCLWSYDEQTCHVDDFNSFGYVDTTEDVPSLSHLPPKRRAAGGRINFTGFISAQFGLLMSQDSERHVGEYSAVNDRTNDAESVAAIFREFVFEVHRQYRGYLHVVLLDSPGFHIQLESGACDPRNLNLSDGGVNRVPDKLFQSAGLHSIWKAHYGGLVEGWHLEDYRNALWEKDLVRNQRFQLEKILTDNGMLMLFNPIHTPMWNPIELLWRDIKYDYRTNFRHQMDELWECLRRWAHDPDDPLDSEWTLPYFNTARAFIDYWLYGGKQKVTERQVKRMARSHFENMVDGHATYLRSMGGLFQRCPDLNLQGKARQAQTVADLFRILDPYLHEVNWMRLRKVDSQGDVGEDESSSSVDENE